MIIFKKINSVRILKKKNPKFFWKIEVKQLIFIPQCIYMTNVFFVQAQFFVIFLILISFLPCGF